MFRLKQILRHRKAHITKPNKTNICHFSPVKINFININIENNYH